MNSNQYYVFLENAVAGPYDAATVREWNLAADTQVCRVGTEDWVELRQEADLLAPPSQQTSSASPFHADESVPLTEKKKIFIIHGKGNTMDDAFERLVSLSHVKFRYFQGNFYVDEFNSNFARYILYETHQNPYLSLMDRVLVGKLVLSPLYPPPPTWQPDQTWTKLSEFKTSDKFGLYGAPTLAKQKKDWADNLFAGIWQEFGRLLGVQITSQPALTASLKELRKRLRLPDGGLYIEREYKDVARAVFGEMGSDPEAFIDCLIELQRLNDGGGDLDTIASNALYGAWLLQAWTRKYGSPPVYGRDFEFDFVNYHQSFLHLARHKNCEIYLPDFPMDAIPDLEASAKALVDAGSQYIRIDDHHPIDQEKIRILEGLKEAGLLEEWVMSGPMKGTEQPREERTCGADLIHKATLKDTSFDSPGLEEMRRLAHQQDLHYIENPDDRSHPDYLAIDLSKLIGSKHSRIDMAQQLMYVRSYDDMRNIMETTGWRQIVDAYEQNLEEILPKLEECIAMIEFVVPEEVEKFGGSNPLSKTLKAITFGAVDIDKMKIKKSHPELVHRIFMTLAPFQSRKEHRINVAAAIGYLKNHYRFDYFFFAWGSSLLTTRRFNEEDQILDLSALMPVIGGAGDGGHSSAATCKPPSNPAWPEEKFSRLKKGNFQQYAEYIGERIESGTNVKVVGARMLTEADRDFA